MVSDLSQQLGYIDILLCEPNLVIELSSFVLRLKKNQIKTRLFVTNRASLVLSREFLSELLNIEVLEFDKESIPFIPTGNWFLFDNEPNKIIIQALTKYKQNIYYLENLKKNSPALAQIQVEKDDLHPFHWRNKLQLPLILADELTHCLRRQTSRSTDILITMGTTKGYVDDVRYISNYSSGLLGTLVAENLYRNGQRTHIVAGPCQFKPLVFTTLVEIETNEDLAMEIASLQAKDKVGAAVMAISVLDFVPERRVRGKIRSDQETLTIKLKKTEKIISTIAPKLGIKIGFKLEDTLDEKKALSLAQKYIPLYNLSLFVANSMDQIKGEVHPAFLLEPGSIAPRYVNTKIALAEEISAHILNKLKE